MDGGAMLHMRQAFPAVEPGILPFGSRVLVQIRTAMRKSRGGIIMTDSDMETEKWNTQVAKVLALGPLAFCNRDTQKKWPEGSWCGVGEYVRVPKYGGDRWEVPVQQREDGDAEKVVLALFNDLDLLGQITSDPTEVKAFF